MKSGTGYVLWLGIWSELRTRYRLWLGIWVNWNWVCSMAGIWGNFDGFPYSCLLFKDECDPELKTELFCGGRRGTYKSTKVGKSCLIVVNK